MHNGRIKDGYLCWMNKSSRQLQKALALPLEICQTKLAAAYLPSLRHRFLAPDVQMLPREGRGQGFSGITQPGKPLCPRTSLPLGIMRYPAQTAFLYMGMGWGRQPATFRKERALLPCTQEGPNASITTPGNTTVNIEFMSQHLIWAAMDCRASQT